VAPAYVVFRIMGIWSGEDIAELSRSVDPDRGSSFEFRLINENLLAEKALKRPVFGWGGWGRNRVFDPSGRDITVTDGLWIIQLGTYGVVGLAALFGWFLVPTLVLLRRIPPRLWTLPTASGAAALTVMTSLYLIDCIPNATCNPVFILAAGGLAGMQVVVRRRSAEDPSAIEHRQAQAEKLPVQIQV